MKRLILILCLAGTACHAPVTITTPAGKTAYTADQIVVRVNELGQAAIAAEAGKALPTTTARTIIQFCSAADKILAATPTGWQAAVATAWLQTKATIGPVTNPAVAAAMGAVDVALAALGGQ